MAGTSPAMTPKGVAYASVQPPVFHIQFSKSQAPSPVFFGEAPGRPVSVPSFLPRANARGMARQVARPLFFQCPCSLSKTRGASRRATQTSLRSLGSFAASSLLRRAALFVDRLLALPASLALLPLPAPTDEASRQQTAIRQPAPGGRLLLAARRSPGAARVRALRGTPAGAASCSTIRRL